MKAQIHIVKEQPSLFWMNVTAKALYLNNTGKLKKLTLLSQQLLPLKSWLPRVFILCNA